MRVEDLIVEAKKHIHSHEAKMLLASLLNYDNLEILNHLHEVVDEEISKKYLEMVEARKNNYPLQYIIGDVNFYGRKFIVNENVLIPRFETEELVEKTFKKAKELFGDKRISILDMGTGSGVIGITLKALLPNSNVTCSDISEEALSLAKENAKSLGEDINFIQSDLFKNILGKYDLIISNPPYIGDKEDVEEQVFKHEPHLALFADDNGTEMYRKILAKERAYLNETYLIAFEIASDQKEVLKSLQSEYFPDAKFECIKDMADKERIVLIYNS